jgi:hypothetical protein
MESAENLLDHLTAGKVDGTHRPDGGKPKKKTSKAESKGYKEGRYPCSAKRSMRIFCILELVIALMPSAASSSNNDWRTSTKATVMINEKGLIDPGMKKRMVKIVNKVLEGS